MDGWVVCPRHKGLRAAGWKEAGVFYKRSVARLPFWAILHGRWEDGEGTSPPRVFRLASFACMNHFDDQAPNTCHWLRAYGVPGSPLSPSVTCLM